MTSFSQAGLGTGLKLDRGRPQHRLNLDRRRPHHSPQAGLRCVGAGSGLGCRGCVTGLSLG